MDCVKIGNRLVGPGQPAYVIGEIGINHNGDLGVATKLVDVAAIAGCAAVKFQKRTVDVVYTPEDLARPRPNPFGSTNGDLKRGLELGYAEFQAIARHCDDQGITWFSSCWDAGSVDFMEQFDVPAYKVASASLTDHELLRRKRATGKPIILSTGMSTLEQIDAAVDVLGKKDLIILHCTSSYPTRTADLNLSLIPVLRERYGVPVGYSGHEAGLGPSLIAVALGACMVERHITVDKAMWGSDQSVSLEPDELIRLVREIRGTELALGDGVKRIADDEVPIMKKLRRVA